MASSTAGGITPTDAESGGVDYYLPTTSSKADAGDSMAKLTAIVSSIKREPANQANLPIDVEVDSVQDYGLDTNTGKSSYNETRSRKFFSRSNGDFYHLTESTLREMENYPRGSKQCIVCGFKGRQPCKARWHWMSHFTRVICSCGVIRHSRDAMSYHFSKDNCSNAERRHMHFVEQCEIDKLCDEMFGGNPNIKAALLKSFTLTRIGSEDGDRFCEDGDLRGSGSCDGIVSDYEDDTNSSSSVLSFRLSSPINLPMTPANDPTPLQARVKLSRLPSSLGPPPPTLLLPPPTPSRGNTNPNEEMITSLRNALESLLEVGDIARKITTLVSCYILENKQMKTAFITYFSRCERQIHAISVCQSSMLSQFDDLHSDVLRNLVDSSCPSTAPSEEEIISYYKRVRCLLDDISSGIDVMEKSRHEAKSCAALLILHLNRIGNVGGKILDYTRNTFSPQIDNLGQAVGGLTQRLKNIKQQIIAFENGYCRNSRKLQN